MLHAILKAKEQQLAKKAQQRLHWWSRHRLRSLILVVPPLAKEIPLWSYNEESLACARLCGLTVIELQNLLRVYWEKPAWKRWLLYWFTPIRHQLTVWTYYQQCITFRSWKVTVQRTNTINYSCPYASEIINRFTVRLIEKMFKLEKYIDRHAMRWRKKFPLFKKEMAESEEELSNKFYLDLKKALHTEVPLFKFLKTREIVPKIYEKVINVVYPYFLDYYRNTYTRILFSFPPQCMQLVLANPSSPTTLTNPPPIRQHQNPTNLPSEPGISSFNFSVWVTTRQKQIQTVLQQQELTAVTDAMNLLQESFFSFTELIEPLVTPTTLLIDRMKRLTSIPAKEAFRFISLLEKQLTKLYRAAIPLFHPDKYQTFAPEANQEFKTFCHLLICHYQIFIKKCQKQLKDRKRDILKIEKQRRANRDQFPIKQLSWAEMWQQLENIENGIKALDEKMEKIDEKLKNHEARIQALFRKRGQEFYSHAIFKLRMENLSVLKEELVEGNEFIVFNK